MTATPLSFETINVRGERAVLFAAIAAPPNESSGTCTGPRSVSLIQRTESGGTVRMDQSRAARMATAVKDRVNAVALAPVEDFRRDSDLFGQSARDPQVQSRIQAAMRRGFQTRDGEIMPSEILGDF